MTVAAITTSIKAGSRLQLVLPQGKPCPQESAILGFQVVTIDKTRLSGLIGSLDQQQLEDLRRLMRLVWAL